MVRTYKILLLQYKVLVVFKVFITAIMLGFGTYLLVIQELNIGEFIATEIVILTIIGAVEKLISSLDSVYDVLTGIDKMAVVTDNLIEEKGTLMVKSGGIGIELIDLSFDYGGGKNVLNDLNFNIPPNSSVCIYGSEGSGKSTLINILAGAYKEFSGNLLYNNIPFNNYDIDFLRSKIGFYGNQDDIFKGTILENINLGNPAITPEKILDLATQLGIENFLISLSMGFDTKTMAMGRFLPSNTVKKILLLRGLVTEPQLILLEEPLMGLDDLAKEKMCNYLFSKERNATIIISSNEAHIIKKCDYKIKIINGKAIMTKNITNG